jgi:hypothetical protein
MTLNVLPTLPPMITLEELDAAQIGVMEHLFPVLTRFPALWSLHETLIDNDPS